MKYCLLLIILISFACHGQGRLTIDKDCSIFGVSVSDQLSFYEDESASLSPEEFLEKKHSLKKVKMTQKLQNFDFTSSSFFIHFTLENQSGKDQWMVLETARPITNRANLYCVDTKTTMYSGDGVSFDKKSVPTNFTVLKLSVPKGEKREYVLHLTSDGENLTVPMVFFDRKTFTDIDSNRQLLMGIILGIFVFVVIIYSAFFVLLKERLFLYYVLYATSSGLLQFSLDGYMHEFVFTSGGYFSQHSVLIVAGPTVILGMWYSANYLVLTGVLKKIALVASAVVALSIILSLVPGILYELAYILINAMSLLILVFMLVAGFIQRNKDKEKVSILFLIGFAFLVLGGLIYILGNFGVIEAPDLTLNALKLGTTIEMIFLSILMAGRYKKLQEEREVVQQRLLLELEEKNRLTAETNQRLEMEVRDRTRKIEAQRLKLIEQNEDFLSSVIYAERIQSAVLSNEEKFKNLLPSSFVLLKPKDVVSGDFCWIDELTNESGEDQIAYVTADCTGHGVPGALVSIIGNHLLESVKASNLLGNPGEALDELNAGMDAALNSKYTVEHLQDGMDLTLCVLDWKRMKLTFSGARNSVYIIRDEELIELKGDRKSIGFNPKKDAHRFQTQYFELQKGDTIYTCSDGYSDQFGGEKGKKFMSKRLRNLFMEVSKSPIKDQKAFLEKTLQNWMEGFEQLDDILVIGVRV